MILQIAHVLNNFSIFSLFISFVNIFNTIGSLYTLSRSPCMRYRHKEVFCLCFIGSYFICLFTTSSFQPHFCFRTDFKEWGFKWSKLSSPEKLRWKAEAKKKDLDLTKEKRKIIIKKELKNLQKSVIFISDFYFCLLLMY